jgi:hypothetical protein
MNGIKWKTKLANLFWDQPIFGNLYVSDVPVVHSENEDELNGSTT